MSKIPFFDLREGTRTIRAEIDEAIARVIDNTAFVLGPEVDRFEEEFASYCDVSYSAGVSSGTSALHLVLQGYGIGPGDEVITVPNTFVATVESIMMTGAEPVLVDVREDTHLIDVDLVEAAVTPRTRAVVPVNLFGQCCDMDPLMKIAEKHNFVVIEDACQSHGAAYKGRKSGSLGHAAAFSFYPSKNLGSFGEGGAVTSNDEKLIGRVRALRHHAQFSKNVHSEIGYNDRLHSIQAAVLRVKLRYLDGWNEKRRTLAARYRKNLEGSGYVMPVEKPERKHVYHLFTVWCADKEAVGKALSDNDIGWGQHYPMPVHLQPAFSNLGAGNGMYPVAERLMRGLISLPMFPELREEAVDRVCEVLRNVETTE